MNNSTFQFEPLHPETKPKFPKRILIIAIFIVLGVIAITTTIIFSLMQSDQENLGKIFIVNKHSGMTKIIDPRDDKITCNLPAMPENARSSFGSNTGGLIGKTVLICGGITKDSWRGAELISFLMRGEDLKETKDCY